MRNYFIQIQELKIAEARLRTLEERKRRLKNKIISCTNELKDVVSFTNATNDKMTNYLIQIEEINDEIEELENEIHILNQNLNTMESALEQTKNVELEIFLLKYRDNLKVKEIARKKNYSIPRVYQYLNKINKKIGLKSKDYKKL